MKYKLFLYIHGLERDLNMAGYERLADILESIECSKFFKKEFDKYWDDYLN